MDIISRTVSEEDMDKAVSLLTSESNQIQYSMSSFCSSGSKYRTIRYEDGERSVNLCVLPKDTFQTVNSNHAEKVDVYAIIYDRNDNVAATVPSEKYENVEIFPELRQSFHESESYQGREADYRYHFEDDTTEIAVRSSNPVSRLEEPVSIVAIEYIGGQFPKKWLIQTESRGFMYLRERSGSVKLYDDITEGEQVFNAYVGREHPGTHLNNHEVINIITSVDYVNIEEDYEETVPEEAHDEYWTDFRDSFSSAGEGELDPDIFLEDDE